MATKTAFAHVKTFADWLFAIAGFVILPSALFWWIWTGDYRWALTAVVWLVMTFFYGLCVEKAIELAGDR